MPLVFSAICPHPPLAIPSIGQENFAQLKNTVAAMENLEQDFYISKPETVIIISPHGKIMPEAFTINHQPVLKGDFVEFGDLETKFDFKNDLPLAYQIKEFVEAKMSLALITPDKLDHGVTIPLYYLARHLKEISVIPLGYSQADPASHLALGAYIRKILDKTNKRVAVIASAELSHRLSESSPAGFSSKGKEFDEQLISYLKDKKIAEIAAMDPVLINEAGQCGYNSILILLGVLKEYNFTTSVMCHESPFGVGCLTAQFRI